MSTDTIFDPAHTTPMDRDECLARLALEPVGRLIVPRSGRPPTIVPAVYLLAGDTLLVRTIHDLAWTRGQPRLMVFAVDRIDPDRQCGWSILVEGVAAPSPDGPVVDASADEGTGDGWLWLSIDVVRGRRIGDGLPPAREEPW